MRHALLVAAAFFTGAAADPIDPLSQATGAALQADASQAFKALIPVDVARLSEKDRKFVTCMRQRFGEHRPASSKKPRNLPERVLATYKSYWHASLMEPGTRDAQEKLLDKNLRRLLNAPTNANIDQLVHKRLRSSGVHSIEGRTGLLRELMIWKDDRTRTVTVVLPESEQRVTVRYLDRFDSLGWSDYATCGRAATAGWATAEGLFAVVPRYKSLEDEEFRVSFLGHEAQHYADKKRFPGLKSWELEYRAKLTELALADELKSKLLDRFIEDQGNDPASPHSYANQKVLANLVEHFHLTSSGALYKLDARLVQQAARDLLLQDSKARTEDKSGISAS